jgi:hypothetical protein
MNKIKLFLVWMTIVMSCCLLTACNIEKSISIGKTSHNSQPVSYDYGVINTSSSSSNSEITLYDSSAKIIKVIKLNYAGLQKGTFQKPKIFNGKLYVTVLGTFSQPGSQILEIDLNDLSYKEIKTHGIVMSIDVDDRYIYVTTTDGTNHSTIEKIDKQSLKILKSIGINSFIQHIKVLKDEIYAFASAGKDKPSIYKLNLKTLGIEKKIPLDFVSTVQDSYLVNNTLYITNQFDQTDKNPTNKIIKLNIKTDRLDYLTLKEYSPFQILKYKDSLIITHVNVVQHTGTSITILNKNTGEQRLINLQNIPYQSIIHQNKLVSTDGNDIYIYDLINFKLLEKKSIRSDLNFSYLFFKN